MASRILFFGVLALCFTVSFAVVDNFLDFCVADVHAVVSNSYACKDPKLVQADDFFCCGLEKPGNTSNPNGSKVTPVYVDKLPGLNTLGISMVRVDYAPKGVNPPHVHPRGSEIMTVLEGSLEVGFVSSGPDYRHFTKVLQRGDVFVFPMGLIHYQRNLWNTPAVAIAALNGQNPGTTVVTNGVFGPKPCINEEILAKAYQIDPNAVRDISAKFQ